jgi:hypothetical protein
MLNHLRTCLVGGNRKGLVCALLLAETLLLTCPTRPSPPPRTAEAGQIVELVDDQGRRIFINSQEQDSGLENRNSGINNRSFLWSGRNPELASLIRKTANRYQVDPDLIHAIVNVESGYDSRAVSPKGAMGLMQLIPATARRFGVEDPFDPRQNIEGGTSYLKYLLGLFDGNIALSLAAYNAGENSVLREGGIPRFPETQEYVRKVRSLYQPVPPLQPSESRASTGSSVVSTQSRKRSASASKAAKQTLEPVGAPFYKYVDGEGVLHIEQ